MNKVFIFSVLVLQTLGCVKEAELPSAGSLEGGAWYGDCHQSTSGAYQTNVINFQNGSYQETIKVYTDGNCSQKILEIAEGGSYVFGDVSQSGSKTTEIDLTLARLTITPSSLEVVNTYNMQSMCGISTWELDVSKEVTGLNCGGETMPTAGKTLYTIYRFFDYGVSELPGFEHNVGDLAFGYTNGTTDGSSAEKRPTSLGSLNYHR